MSKRYSFETDILDGEEHSDQPWRCYSTVVAEGDTLDELLDDATVGLLDQDGGERGDIPLGYLPESLQLRVTRKFEQMISDADGDDPVGALIP